MSNKLLIFSNDQEQKAKRLPYHKPQLVVLGDLRTLTLGGSPGSGDTGATIGTQNPYFGPNPGLPNPGGFEQPNRPRLP